MERVNKIDYYLGIADVVSKRGTCLRGNYGAVIVKDDRIIATGYTGAPRGRKNCMDCGYCKREKLNVPHGERYELCRSVHAEQNAIIQANGQDTIGSTIYICGHDTDTGKLRDGYPCAMCERVIINAGIETIIIRMADGSHKVIPVQDLIDKDDFV